MRQTVRVEDIVDYGNFLLQVDASEIKYYETFGTREYKEAICDMIEKVLQMSGRYGGYIVLDSHKEEANYRHKPEFWKRKYLIKNK